MLFMIVGFDKPESAALRQQNRAAHLDYLAGFDNQVYAAGPLQSDDGSAMVGSLLLMDFPDRVAAEAFTAGDPYGKAGVFESVIIRRWKKIMPAE